MENTIENAIKFIKKDSIRIRKMMKKSGREWSYGEIENSVVPGSYVAYASAVKPDREEPDGWISVKDRLPEENEWVLIVNNNDDTPVQKAKYGIDSHMNDVFTIMGVGTISGKYVTHWMPLPPIPTKTKEL